MSANQDFNSQREKLHELCDQLRKVQHDDIVSLAKNRVQLLGEFDVYRWFVPIEFGGFGWNESEIMKGYLQLSKACLSTAFVLTQRSGAVRRIADSSNDDLKQQLLPLLAAGDHFSTVGISHLTTSRRHLGQPVLRGEKTTTGYRLDGYSPWVTGVTLADSVIVGVSCADRIELLINVATDLPGVTRPPTPQLVALSDSCTGEIHFDNVDVDQSQVVAGPIENVMSAGTGGKTGGLQTSTLALGLAKAAIDYIEEQSAVRDGFEDPYESLNQQWLDCHDYLFDVAHGNEGCTNEVLRTRVNSLVLRSTQAALMVAKGAGYCAGHPVGRWCQEALFFLVWSCPQPVAESNLCELAQIN